MPTHPEKKIFYYGTGRRKSAVARVYLRSGKGKITINEKPIDEYFKRETFLMLVHQPLEVVRLSNVFDIKVTVEGGGSSGQVGAIQLGIARALVQYAASVEVEGEKTPPKTNIRKELRKKKFLTRDPRIVERKKYGLHKARKRSQYSKR